MMVLRRSSSSKRLEAAALRNRANEMLDQAEALEDAATEQEDKEGDDGERLFHART
jgi:hypothetical protein